MLLGPGSGAGMKGEFLLKQTVHCWPQSEVLTEDCTSLCVWDKTFGLTANKTTHTSYIVPLIIYEVGAGGTRPPTYRGYNLLKLNILISRFISRTEMKTSSRLRSHPQNYF